ncbi:hypothetical protein BDV28DRAFT_164093 [Aspergillus coremiiformis]|uniref:Uncharacterized protein n=1 Tax=Aspergillus coremiiformis TaxID=138285 RepID=A0A5N6YVT4_9EURO|nr:hypothetical protein BDV28DRAFT_164093 [Aspergillus coremiiformis]
MCQMVVFWHACTHLVVSYLTCAFEEARNHKEETATTAVLDTDCWICQQHKKYPYSGESETMQRLLLTVHNMEDILGVSAHEDGFLDMIARFYARGDHKRWMQPGIAKAKYAKDDPYLRGLEIQSYLCTRGFKDFHMNPGYAFDIVLAMQKHWDRSNFSTLNWARTGYRPPSEFFFVSSNMIAMLSPSQNEVVDIPKTEVPPVAQRCGHLSNGSVSMVPQSTMGSTRTGELGQCGYNHTRTGLSARSPSQWQSFQSAMDAQTSLIYNDIRNPGLSLSGSDGRPCEALNGSPFAIPQNTHHVFHSLSPLGEPGPSIEYPVQALGKRASRQVSFHTHTSSLTDPLFSAEHDEDMLMNEASHSLDSNHYMKTLPLTYSTPFSIPDNQILHSHPTPRETINQMYFEAEPSAPHFSSFEETINPTTHSTKTPFSPTLGNAIIISRSPTATSTTVAPDMLDLNNLSQLQIPNRADGTCGKAKQPIRDISQLDPYVPEGFEFTLAEDSMDNY